MSQRALRSPGAAWAVAALLAWLAAASCRTLPVPQAAPVPVPPAESVSLEGLVPAPAVRVGILVDVARVSIGADSGVVVHSAGSAPRTLARATFRPAEAPGRIRLLETGDELERATLVAEAPSELLQADATTYRGVLEVRPGVGAAVTVVNVVNLEDYLRGVVPNELSPEAFPQIEALKAQAVAARSYALAHLAEYSGRGFDVCATASCQVYRGQSSEHPLTDRAVAETEGMVASYQGRPINAYYTSTCGGHTEDVGNVFENESEPYLRGVACLPERSARYVVHTSAPRRRYRPGEPDVARETALLTALGIIEGAPMTRAWLGGIPSDGELRSWTLRLVRALHREGCPSPVGGALARRGTYAQHLVASLCWRERAERLLAPGDPEYLLRAEDAARLQDPGERQAMALLVGEGLLSPFADDTLRPDAALTRAEALALLAGAAEKAGAPALATGQFAGLAEGRLAVLRGEAAESHPLDPAVRLFRSLDGMRAETSDLIVSLGDRVSFVTRDNRVVFLEAEQTRLGAAADRGSRYYRWEVRMSPSEVARAIGRYGGVGQVSDLVPRRIGVSGRVVELLVRGSDGELLLKGLQVRWGLGLRENLFVIARERDGQGGVERFVITGKGWGHGVGLCQVGAAGMAQAGSRFDEILQHYYQGIELRAHVS